jgi:hypothetical protein
MNIRFDLNTGCDTCARADALGKKSARGWAGQDAPGPLAVGLWAKFGPAARFHFRYYFQIL